jgi:uncharacterized protein YndB with AHSA1/START domain
MENKKGSRQSILKDNQIGITRVYDASVKQVWDAWTDPKKVAIWWGPRGFTITTHSKDLRPGGHWSYTMHGPDGTNYENKTLYFEVEKYKKLVYDHGGNDDRPPLFRVNAEFTEMGRKTKLEMTMTFSDAEITKQMRKFIKDAGGNSTWDRLAEFLDKETIGKESFVINRSFEVPLKTMFEMWTNPEHLSKWLAPSGFKMEFYKAEIKTDGESHYMMTDGEKVKMFGKARYIEVKSPDRLVYTQTFVDEKGSISRHPMAPTWPETMLTIVELSEEGPTTTRVTVKWEVHGAVSPEELETFIKSRGGMTQGWTGSFDKLEDYLVNKVGQK